MRITVLGKSPSWQDADGACSGYLVEEGDDALLLDCGNGVFVVFGSLLTLDGLFGDGWAAVAVVVVTLLVARPVAVWLALAGAHVPRDEKAFIAWFGPKGVATMTFSLLVLNEAIPEASRIFNLAALAVMCSIVAHGVTDTPGAEWIARRAERRAVSDAAPPVPAR